MCTGTHPYIPVPNTAKVDLIFDTNGGVAMNSFYFEKGSALTEADLTAIATAAEDAWEADIAPGVAEAITLNRTVVTDLTTDSSGQVVNPGGISGSNSGGSLPDNVTIAVSLRSALRGRSFRGRVFHVGLPASDVDGDSISDAHAAEFVTAYQAFKDDVEAAVSGITMVVVSLCHDNTWRTTGVTTPITSIQVDTKLDSQRLRLLGRGI